MRRLLYLVVLLAVAAAVVWAFLPRPVPVDVGTVVRGPLVVTVEGEGRTRIRERYVVAAPVSGHLRRLPVEAGGPVEAGRTVLARIDPEASSLVDERTRQTAQARLAEAEDAREQAKANAERARSAEELATTTFERVRRLFDERRVPRQELDDAESRRRIAVADRRSADFAVNVAEHEVEMARIALECCGSEDGADAVRRIEIAAPVDGVVLRVLQESARVVRSGEAILEVGDPRDLEVEVDLLTTEAVRVVPGAPAALERWGGEQPLAARVRLVEPSAVTKVSALGVEEQRVWVRLDLLDPPEAWTALGDGYRVEVRIVVWEAADALKVPAGALFRVGDVWAVYRLVDGRARRTLLRLGASNGLEAEVLGASGDPGPGGPLRAGDAVVLYPGEDVEEDVRVAPR